MKSKNQYKPICFQYEKIIRALIKDCLIFELNHQIKNKTILLRKKYRIKLPDAIIAATAIENNIKLLLKEGFTIQPIITVNNQTILHDPKELFE